METGRIDGRFPVTGCLSPEQKSMRFAGIAGITNPARGRRVRKQT